MNAKDPVSLNNGREADKPTTEKAVPRPVLHSTVERAPHPASRAERTGSSKIFSVWLLWCDVISPSYSCHRAGFAVFYHRVQQLVYVLPVFM